MQMPTGLIAKILAIECTELSLANRARPGPTGTRWKPTKPSARPATPPSSPPLTPPSAPPPPDCAAYDAQLDIVAATSAGARANSGFGGNNVGITVLSSDQGQRAHAE